MNGQESHQVMAEAKAPGKLYIAGEYAVVEHGHPAILVAVDKYLTVQVLGMPADDNEQNDMDGRAIDNMMTGETANTAVSEIARVRGDIIAHETGDRNASSESKSKTIRSARARHRSRRNVIEPVGSQTGHIYSHGHPEATADWHRRGDNDRLVLDVDRPGASFIVAVVQCVEALARIERIALRPFDINVSSELDDESGRKYGLGSSAAVTIATMKAMLKFYGLELSALEQYKLAFIASSRAQKVGSGGDLAASLFGGCIRFCSVDRAWVTARLQDTDIQQLIHMPWPDLHVSRVHAFTTKQEEKSHDGGRHRGGKNLGDAAAGLKLLVGWTGSPASTSDLVSSVQEHNGSGKSTNGLDITGGFAAKSVHGSTGEPTAGSEGKSTYTSVSGSVNEPARDSAQGSADTYGVCARDYVQRHAAHRRVSTKSHRNERAYQEFLSKSDRCVDALIFALTHDDMPGVQRQMAQARALLASLSSLTGTVIETPTLTKLVSIAVTYGAAAKSSGAGGGDCGIAIISEALGTETNSNGVDMPTTTADSSNAGVVQKVSTAKNGLTDVRGKVNVPSTANVPVAENGATKATRSPYKNSIADHIRNAWRQFDIIPLDLNVCQPLADLEDWQDPSSRRKDDHVRLALHQHESEAPNAFDNVRFIHHSLGGVSLSRVDTGVTICGSHWDLPFFINAMTGGSANTGHINEALSDVAGATGLAIASGSQHAALRNAALEPTFATIREHTDGFVFANVGPTVSPEQAQRAVNMIQANALQIHINLAQEIVMPEGDRDFSTWPERIRAIADAVDVPVIVKEVGFGMSRSTIERLIDLGIRHIDVSGRGGTDFAVIENNRRRDHEYGYLDEWGQSTVLSLLEAERIVDGNAADGMASSSSTTNGLPSSAGTVARTVSASVSAAAASRAVPASICIPVASAVPRVKIMDSQTAMGSSVDSSVQSADSAVTIFASGGVRTPFDVVKSLALGASAVGVSGHFLRVLTDSGREGLISEINSWAEQIRGLMGLLGAASVQDLRHTDILLGGHTLEEARLLDIDVKSLAHRSR